VPTCILLYLYGGKDRIPHEPHIRLARRSRIFGHASWDRWRTAGNFPRPMTISDGGLAPVFFTRPRPVGDHHGAGRSAPRTVRPTSYYAPRQVGPKPAHGQGESV